MLPLDSHTEGPFMQTKPPEDYTFAFTLNQLFTLTEYLTKCRTVLDHDIAETYTDSDEDARRVLLAEREDLTDIIDMLTVPIDVEATAWKLAEQGIYSDHDNASTASNDNTSDDEMPEDFKDYLYKN